MSKIFFIIPSPPPGPSNDISISGEACSENRLLVCAGHFSFDDDTGALSAAGGIYSRKKIPPRKKKGLGKNARPIPLRKKKKEKRRKHSFTVLSPFPNSTHSSINFYQFVTK